MQRQHPSNAADTAHASAPARPRSTRERGPDGRMRGKLAAARPRRRWPARPPRRRLRADRAARATSPSSTAPATPRRRRSRSPGACAPTACRTSRTRSPARGLLFSASGLDLVARVQGGAGEMPEAPAERRASRPRHDRRTPPRRHWRSCVTIAQCMRRHGVPEFPDPRTSVPSNPVRRRHRRDNRFRRSDPSVPAHAQHAFAGVHAGGGRVRRPRREARPRPALMKLPPSGGCAARSRRTLSGQPMRRPAL